MSEAATEVEAETQGGENQTSGTTPTADEFKAITTQDELNRVLDDRLRRERAKFSDYRDVKAKAARLDEIEQANQTELERATTRVQTAESDRNSAQAEALRLRTAIEHGISIEDADLFLTATDQESLTAQAKRLAERTATAQQQEAERKKKSPSVPTEGTSTKSGTTTEEDDREFARTFFGGSA